MKPESTAPTDALHIADMYAQSVHQLADTTLKAVRALLTRPDDPEMRMAVVDLVRRLTDEACAAMNEINVRAEQFGVNFKDDQWDAYRRTVCAAVHAKNKGGNAT